MRSRLWLTSRREVGATLDAVLSAPLTGAHGGPMPRAGWPGCCGSAGTVPKGEPAGCCSLRLAAPTSGHRAYRMQLVTRFGEQRCQSCLPPLLPDSRQFPPLHPRLGPCDRATRSGRPGELRVYLVYLVKVHMSYTPPEKKVCPCRHLHQRASLGLRRLMSMREITHRCFIRRHLRQLEQPAIPRPSGDFRDRPGIDARPSSD